MWRKSRKNREKITTETQKNPEQNWANANVCSWCINRQRVNILSKKPFMPSHCARTPWKNDLSIWFWSYVVTLYFLLNCNIIYTNHVLSLKLVTLPKFEPNPVKAVLAFAPSTFSISSGKLFKTSWCNRWSWFSNFGSWSSSFECSLWVIVWLGFVVVVCIDWLGFAVVNCKALCLRAAVFLLSLSIFCLGVRHYLYSIRMSASVFLYDLIFMLRILQFFCCFTCRFSLCYLFFS